MAQRMKSFDMRMQTTLFTLAPYAAMSFGLACFATAVPVPGAEITRMTGTYSDDLPVS